MTRYNKRVGLLLKPQMSYERFMNRNDKPYRTAQNGTVPTTKIYTFKYTLSRLYNGALFMAQLVTRFSRG